MKLVRRTAAISAVGVLAVAVPAFAAKPAHPVHPRHHGKPAAPVTSTGPTTSPAPTKSHKCRPHKVAYVATGTVVSWAATQNSNGTWTGTITVQVKHANHHAASTKRTATTETLTNAKVRLGHGVANPPAAGSRVQVKGSITVLAKKCSQTGFAPTITIKRANVHTAHRD